MSLGCSYEENKLQRRPQDMRGEHRIRGYLLEEMAEVDNLIQACSFSETKVQAKARTSSSLLVC